MAIKLKYVFPFGAVIGKLKLANSVLVADWLIVFN